MKGKKWIFFDCMETIIDVKIIPDEKLYAYWAYSGSGLEKHWDSFEEFFEEFVTATVNLDQQFGPFKEFSLLDRFDLIVKRIPEEKSSKERESFPRVLEENYWQNYKNNCQIEKKLPEILETLAESFFLGIVSNFKKRGGIEELLRDFELLKFFNFVVTSIDTGWKKPHKKIFEKALLASNAQPEEVVFVGDDYALDYCGSGKLGIKCILLDRGERFPEVPFRIFSLEELPEKLKEI